MTTRPLQGALSSPDLSLASRPVTEREVMLTERATSLGQLCATQGHMIATAESCTGGMIARALTDTAGSSAWFEAGFVTYSNGAKHRLLGVPEDMIQSHGAVSEPVARSMAAGALQNSDAVLSMAVTGVAGPGGGSVEKPVGTVWFGWASRVNSAAEKSPMVWSQLVNFEGDRAAVRLLTAIHALNQLMHLIGGDSPDQTG